jgi:ribosomal protein S18 acetylase RimI-like enzyme
MVDGLNTGSMQIAIRREDSSSLADYASIPILFEVDTAVETAALRIGGADLTYRAVTPPRVKDYDRIPGNDPLTWADRFGIDTWTFLAAYDELANRIGGAAVICDPAGIAQAGGRPSYALLWDLRVAPTARRRGVGTALLRAAEEAARAAGCRGLDVETQDINVAACRLYAAHGFTLTNVAPAAYPEAPDETKLTWTQRFR